MKTPAVLIPWSALEDLCRVLNVEPGDVREIRLRAPDKVELTLYALDSNGSKHLDPATGGIETLTFSATIETEARAQLREAQS